MSILLLRRGLLLPPSGGGGGAPLGIVQVKKGVSTDQNVSFSFDAAPTNGNDIVLFVAGSSYMQTTGSGWSEDTDMRVASPSWMGMNCWYRKQSGSGNSFSYSLDSAEDSSWIAIEYEGGASSPFDVGAGQHTNSGAGGYTTPSITPAAGDVLLLGAIAAQRPSADMSGDTTGWTNSFTHLASSGPVSATGDRPSVSVGYRIVTADGSTSYSTGASWPFLSPDAMASQIVSLKGA